MPKPRIGLGGAAGAFACFALAATVISRPAPILLWNASASSPTGLYGVGPGARLEPGDFAIAWPPPAARRLAARRRYLPAGVPLVKRVAAAGAARICAWGRTITIDGLPVASRLPRDRAGRPLPWWSGCRRLRNGEIFLLSPDRPDAFDGRYFGVTESSEIVGRGRLLWKA